MCDSWLGQPLTFLRQSHSFFRESCSIFCLSPSWPGVPLSAFFAYCCTLSCKLQLAEHHGEKKFYLRSLPYFKEGNNMRSEIHFVSSISIALFASQPTSCQGCASPSLCSNSCSAQMRLIPDPYLCTVDRSSISLCFWVSSCSSCSLKAAWTSPSSVSSASTVSCRAVVFSSDSFSCNKSGVNVTTEKSPERVCEEPPLQLRGSFTF